MNKLLHSSRLTTETTGETREGHGSTSTSSECSSLLAEEKLSSGNFNQTESLRRRGNRGCWGQHRHHQRVGRHQHTKIAFNHRVGGAVDKNCVAIYGHHNKTTSPHTYTPARRQLQTTAVQHQLDSVILLRGWSPHIISSTLAAPAQNHPTFKFYVCLSIELPISTKLSIEWMTLPRCSSIELNGTTYSETMDPRKETATRRLHNRPLFEIKDVQNKSSCWSLRHFFMAGACWKYRSIAGHIHLFLRRLSVSYYLF